MGKGPNGKTKDNKNEVVEKDDIINASRASHMGEQPDISTPAISRQD